jgi:cytochrome P450
MHKTPTINISIFDILLKKRDIKIDFFAEFKKKHGYYYKLKMADRRIMVCTSPEGIKHVLVDNNKNYTKSFAYDIIKIFLGNGLLTSEGEFWKKQRRLAQPAFHKQKLELMFQNMLEETNQTIHTLKKFADTNQEINFNSILYNLTLNIVNKTLFFNEVQSTTAKVYELVSKGSEFISDRVENPIRLPDWVPTPKNLEEKAIIRKMDDLFFEIIKRRRKEKSSHLDLLSMYMDAVDEETGEQMSDKQLRDEILTIFVAGHETTNIALAWTFYLLYKNPGKLEILLKEIDEHITNDDVKPETFRNMPYLKLVIEESMRIYPPAWIMGRKAIQEDFVEGNKLHAGENIVMPIYLVHHDSELWENPETFIPERFLPENLKEKHKYAYFPFGGGPRLCIGNNFAIQEMQIALALILKNFNIQISDNFVPTLDPLVTLRQKNTLFAKILSRK